MKDIYSVNSLKTGKKQPEFARVNKETKRGDIFHALTCCYLKGFQIEKLESALNKDDSTVWTAHKNSGILKFALSADEKFIEYSFFVKENNGKKPFYLAGRFDAVVRYGKNYTILDWKTRNLPKNPKEDIQTLVYTFAASKLFKTDSIEIIYYSIEEQKTVTVPYSIGCVEKIRIAVNKGLKESLMQWGSVSQIASG